MIGFKTVRLTRDRKGASPPHNAEALTLAICDPRSIRIEPPDAAQDQIGDKRRVKEGMIPGVSAIRKRPSLGAGEVCAPPPTASRCCISGLRCERFSDGIGNNGADGLARSVRYNEVDSLADLIWYRRTEWHERQSQQSEGNQCDGCQAIPQRLARSFARWGWCAS